MSQNRRIWRLLLLLGVFSAPLVFMYVYLFVDTISASPPGTLIPKGFTLEHWQFLWHSQGGRPSIWLVSFNSLVFAATMTVLDVSISLTAGYALSRLNLPFRRFFLAGILVLHAFPTITLIIAIFLILQIIGLYNSLIGVILVKASLEIPFGIWIMKGFYDTVSWEIEMAGIQDGASRFMVWRKLVLPQVKPAILALGIFAFLSGWSEYILPQVLAPNNNFQVLSVYLASLIADDQHFDFAMFKSVGVFYVLPVIIVYLIFQKHLMNIYGGGSKG